MKEVQLIKPIIARAIIDCRLDTVNCQDAQLRMGKGLVVRLRIILHPGLLSAGSPAHLVVSIAGFFYKCNWWAGTNQPIVCSR